MKKSILHFWSFFFWKKNCANPKINSQFLHEHHGSLPRVHGSDKNEAI